MLNKIEDKIEDITSTIVYSEHGDLWTFLTLLGLYLVVMLGLIPFIFTLMETAGKFPF